MQHSIPFVAEIGNIQQQHLGHIIIIISIIIVTITSIIVVTMFDSRCAEFQHICRCPLWEVPTQTL